MINNIIANFFGRFWSILSNFLFIPLYIKYLGFHSYSLISFTLVVAGVMTVLDSGLTSTLSREFARKNNDFYEKKKIFKTLESLFLLIVIIVISLVFFSSEIITNNWFDSSSEIPSKTSQFFKILSFDIGFQLLIRFYMGGLLGLEKQVKANIYQMLWGITRNGFVVVLICIIPRLDYFFIWQSISTIIFALVFRILLINSLKIKFLSSLKFTLNKSVIKNTWRFAGGMMLISLVAVFNTQMDKMIISKLLPIESLGYYSLSVSLATGIVVLVNPISTAILPRFTSLYSICDKTSAFRLFYKTNKYIALIILPVFITISVFPYELIWIWTGDRQTAEIAKSLLPIISVAYVMLAFAILPYVIAIANGYTKLNNLMGIISVIVTLPSYMLIVHNHGVKGIAIVFAIVQFLTTLFFLFIINKKFLGSKKDFLNYLKHYLFISLTSFIVVLLFSHIPTFVQHNRLLSLIWICIAFFTSLIVCIRLYLPKKELVIIANKIRESYKKIKNV